MKKRITRKEIAELCGVSQSTVTRALNDHPSIPEKTRERIKTAALRRGYIPSELSRNYYQGRSFRISLVVPSPPDRQRLMLPDEYFTRTMYGMVFAAADRGYHVSVVVDPGMDSDDLARLVLSHSADGLVFIGCRKGDNRFDTLYKKKIPFIFIHHYVPGTPYLFVDCDPEPGMRQAFEYIQSANVRTLGFLSAGTKFINSVDRQKAVRTFARNYDMKIICRAAGDYTRSSGRRAAGVFLKNELPELIFCANDRMAFGLIEGLQADGVRVPRDVRVIGFDDQDICTLARPAITTIENPFYRIGELAAEKLINCLDGKNETGVNLSSRLIPRDSA